MTSDEIKLITNSIFIIMVVVILLRVITKGYDGEII